MEQLTSNKPITLMLQKKIASGMLIGFSALWLILYLADVFSNNIAYLVMVASFFFALFITLSKGRKRTLSDILLTIALFFTCVADIFMGFLQEQLWCIEIGVTIFALVQTIYAVRICATRNGRAAFRDKRFRIGLWVRISAIAAAFLALGIVFWDKPVLKSHTYLLIITAVYTASALVNIIYALIYAKHNPLVAIGLILLFACDVFLGMAFLGVPVARGYFANVSVSWIFYIPSQTILALSILTDFD